MTSTIIKKKDPRATHHRKTLLWSFRILFGFIAFYLILIFGWGLLMRAPFLAVFAFVGLIIFSPFELEKGFIRLKRLGLLILTLVLVLFFYYKPFDEVQREMDRIAFKLNKSGHSELSTIDKMGIYSINLAMAKFGYIFGVPEIAKETFYMCIDGPKVRKWNSDFAMESPKIISALNTWKGLINRHKAGSTYIKLPTKKINWDNYNTDKRVALALNPFTFECEATKEGDHWRMDCKGSVPCKYPSNSRTKLLDIKEKPFLIEEGIFWALQEEGWLFPYTAEWSWTIYNDDPRLK
ncbi:MAG: hypothetical protein P9X24_11025 [Candidatus Hatepunaea meridiana]|nr:hypothetical protein [Candidatus Hatepunaea meridiana]